MAPDEQIILRLGHSPDPDDAFMWWPLTPDDDGDTPMDTGRFRFEPVMQDIETLNERSAAADLEITAISAAQYPHVADRYAITSCGASMGENYGPKLVTREPMTVENLRRGGFPIAVPGERTTAALLTAMILGAGRERFTPIPFDQVIDRVASGEFDAGVVIHEGQLTFADSGLHLVQDVGEWWHARTGLPLPLGLNVIRRDLDDLHGPGTIEAATALLRRSIDFAMGHRADAVAYAMRYARGVSEAQADEFVSMYVSAFTVDCGETGEQAIRTLLEEAANAGLAPRPQRVHVIRPTRAPVET